MSYQVVSINEIPILELGEGPHWDVKSQTLYFVNIVKKTLYKFNPKTKKLTKATFEKNISFVIPVEGTNDQFVISQDRDIVVITWDGVSTKVSGYKKICELDNSPGTLTNKINDGKCDPNGKLWTGTLNENFTLDPAQGALYSLEPNGQPKKHLDSVILSNGLAWNAAGTKMYYADTGKKIVEEFDYDPIKGISNSKVILSLEKHNIDGAADGMTIDSNDNVWVAIYGGSAVLKINPNKPEIIQQTVKIPASQVTSVTFGGPNLDELYVTSGNIVLKDLHRPTPDNGKLFVVTGLGVKGLPAVNARLKL